MSTNACYYLHKFIIKCPLCNTGPIYWHEYVAYEKKIDNSNVSKTSRTEILIQTLSRVIDTPVAHHEISQKTFRSFDLGTGM